MKNAELLRLFFENLTGYWEDTQKRLAAVNDSPAVKEYGPAAARLERLKAVKDFQKGSREMLSKFTSQTWPLAEAERQAEAERVYQSILNGARKPATPLSDDQLGNMGVHSQEARIVYRQFEAMRESITSAVSESTRETRKSNAFTAFSMQTTEALETRITNYLESASGPLETFDGPGWRIDQEVLPAVIAQRARSGDDRAKLLLQNHPDLVGEVKNSIMLQTVEPDMSAEFALQRTGDILDGLISVDGGQPIENLADAQKWFLTLQNAVDGKPDSDEYPSPAIPNAA